MEPKEFKSMKIIYLYLKSAELYEVLLDFINLFVTVATKTHAEGLAESIGNYVEMHAEKKEVLIEMRLAKRHLYTVMDLQSPMILLYWRLHWADC